MNHLDLFSGIGGFAYAAQQVWDQDHNIVAFIEQNKYCQENILNKHWPQVPIIDDIRNYKHDKAQTVDLLTGGFPCQPFSVAGKQKGAEDNRYLWPEMARVIQETEPTWIIGENVGGLVNMAQLDLLPDLEDPKYSHLEEGTIHTIEGPGYLETILEEIEKMGYYVQPFIIPACAVDARHRRDRIWIVANSCGMRYDKSRFQNSDSKGQGIVQETPEGVGERCRGGNDTGGYSEILPDTKSGGTGGIRDEIKKEGSQSGNELSGELCSVLPNSESVGFTREFEQREGNGIDRKREFFKHRQKGGEIRSEFKRSGEDVSDTKIKGLEGFTGNDSKRQFSDVTPDHFQGNSNNWPVEPGVGRVAHGVPSRVDRLKGLGNAIVPQAVIPIMKCIKELEKIE